MPDHPAIAPASRRSFLARSAGIAAGAAALSILPRAPLWASPQAMHELIRKIVGEAPVQTGKVRLDVGAGGARFGLLPRFPLGGQRGR